MHFLYCLCLCAIDHSSSGGMSGGHSFTHEMIENENDHLVNALSEKLCVLLCSVVRVDLHENR